jgi:hypothetical protein
MKEGVSMSKRLPKRKFVGIMKQPQELLICPAERIALYAKRAMDYFTPLIRAKNMVLIAMKTNGDIHGDGETPMTASQIHQMCNTIITAWKQGLFTPCSTYPYTLEQTITALSEE